MLATLLFAAINVFLYESREPAIVFFGTAILCLPALWLNRRGHYRVAGGIAAVLVLAAAHYNLLDGAGLRDPGIAAYPIIIIAGGLLFGKRMIPLFAAACIASLASVVYAQPDSAVDLDRLLILSILILTAASTTWVIMENMEKYIARIKRSESDLRQAYEQTQAQARQVHRIIETVPEGVLMLDTERHVTLANQTARQFLNILTPSHEDHFPLKRIGEASVEAILDATGSGGWREISVSGGEIIFEVAARPVQSEPVLLRDWVLVLRDVTRQRKQQNMLQEQERLATVGRLASGIAHDFRNILTVISTYSQLLQVKPDTPKRSEYLTVIQRQSQDAAHLIDQILDFGRRSVMERKVTDIVDLVEDLVALLQRTMPSNISIESESDPGGFYLNADRTRLQQALMNLAVNARDAMPGGGSLRFALSANRPSKEIIATLQTKPAAWLCLQVSDTGKGIEATDLPHIFEPFFTKRETGQGTGLGLAQVYGIVKQHEGAITVSSTVGEGTTFELYFPAVIDEPAVQISQDGEHFSFDREITVLLVEDNPLTRHSTEEMLRMLGCRVISAEDGHEGLAIFQAQQEEIDLVISDIVMPKKGGIELYRTLQEIAPDLKMLLTTGYPLDEQAKTLLEQEVVEWVQKPYKIMEIARKIGNALARQK
jgi:two-component system cell cycle sensor histidine kinase/response regulator CckA